MERGGVHSAAQAVANELGTSVAQAKSAIDTAAKLEWLPETNAAFRSGDLSVAQGEAVAKAAVAAPGSERSLLDAAKIESLATLRKQADEIHLRADQSADASARRHAKRAITTGPRPDAMFGIHGEIPDVMAGEIMSVWDCYTDEPFRTAQREGRRESRDAYRADGLLAMARVAAAAAKAGNRLKVKAIRAHFAVRVDARPFMTNQVDVGEVCEIAGIGPIDLAEARKLLPDALLDVVVHDGVDVRTLAHPGRRANARQLAVLLAREYVCEIEGCGATHNLQLDHIREYRRSKRTCCAELGWKCGDCHRLKTHKHYTDGPLQPNRRRKLIPPKTDGPAP